MGFFGDLLEKVFGAGGAQGDNGIYVYVRLQKTGEIVELRLIPRQELVPDYKNGGFFSHKVITGPRTLARADAVLRFDEQRRFTTADISGGELSDRAAFEAQGTR